MTGMVIQSPDNYTYGRDRASIFLAGGITGCPDWQGPVANRIAGNTNFVVINPRRAEAISFTDEVSSYDQIVWEHENLAEATEVLFWFPAEGLCMITLFELGKMLHRFKGADPYSLHIGVHPEYIRRFDIITQVGLEFPDMLIWDDLDRMVDNVIRSCNVNV